MLKRFMFVLSLLLMIPANGVADEFVSLVKSSSLTGWPSEEIGAAFDSSFDNAEWKSFVSDDGKRIVQFKGKISQELNVRGAVIDAQKAVLAMVRKDVPGGNDAYQKVVNTAIMMAQTEGAKYRRYVDAFRHRGMTEKQQDWALAEIAFGHVHWPTGSEVIFQWEVRGDDFNFYACSGPSWENKDVKDVLDVIFNVKPRALTPAEDDELQAYEKLRCQVISVSLEIEHPFGPVRADQTPPTTPSVSETKEPGSLSLESMVAQYLSPPADDTRRGEWVVIGDVETEYDPKFRIVTDNWKEAETRYPDYMLLDYSTQGEVLPSISIAVRVLSSVEEVMESCGWCIFNILVDGKKVGRIDLRGEPSADGEFVHMKDWGCPQIAHVYKAMKNGKRLSFILDDATEPSFVFDLKGLKDADQEIQRVVNL